MTITFSFNGTRRSFDMEPGNDLEAMLLKDMAVNCEKGASIIIKPIQHPGSAIKEYALYDQTYYRVELVVKP